MGLLTASVGDLPLATRRRKATHIDLPFSRLVREISDPTSIGRETAVLFRKICLEEEHRFLLPKKRQHPQVPVFLGLVLIKDVTPVRRPIVGEFGVARLEKKFVAAGAA